MICWCGLRVDTHVVLFFILYRTSPGQREAASEGDVVPPTPPESEQPDLMDDISPTSFRTTGE